LNYQGVLLSAEVVSYTMWYLCNSYDTTCVSQN